MLMSKSNFLGGFLPGPSTVFVTHEHGIEVFRHDGGLFAETLKGCVQDFVVVKALRQGEHDTAPKGDPKDRADYADPEHYAFPIDTHEHVRAAISYFNKHNWSASEHKARAARRILRAAKKFGIDVSRDSDVARAAKGE